MKRENKGGTQIDWVISFLFFISIVFISVYYSAYISSTKQPYESPLKSQLVDLSKSVEDQMTWTIYIVPLTINSPYYLENYPMYIHYIIDNETKNSTYIQGTQNDILSTEVDTGESRIYWVSGIWQGKNQFYLYYIPDSSLNESSNSTASDLTVEGYTTANSRFSAQYDNFSITSLIFNSREFVGTSLALGTSNAPLITNNTVRTLVSYPENITITQYTNSSRLFIHAETPADFVFKFSTYPTHFYVAGTSYEFNGTNTFSGITGYADLYNSTGIAVIGSSLNITIDDPGASRDVYIYDAIDFELYLHDSDYTAMLNESAIYPGPEIIIGLPERMTGIREDRIGDLENIYYQELEEKLQVDDLGVLVRIENPGA